MMKRGIILYAFIMSILLVCTIVMGNFAYKEVSDAQMLGKVSLHPVKFKEELNTRKEGDVTYVTGRTYYIIYEYQWDGKQENVRLKCDEIYSQNDRETAKAAIKNQEIIERIIYLDNFGKRHFSKCETTKAFQHKHVRTELMPCVMISVIILFPGILWLIIYLAKKREIGLLQSQRPNAIICTGISFIICFFLEIGLFIVVMGVCMLVGLASDPLEAAVCGVLIISEGLAPITFLFMQIWNRRVVLDKEEVLFKNAFGKEKRYSKTEITQCRTLNYSAYNGAGFIRRRNFYIHVGKEIIALNDCMTNYYEAIDFAKRNYMCENSGQN